MLAFDNSLQENIFFNKSTIGDTKCLKYEISFDYFNLVKRFVLKIIDILLILRKKIQATNFKITK